MARKPSTKMLVPDLPEKPDHETALALESTEFADASDTVESVYREASEAIHTVTGVEAGSHFSTNQSGNPRVGLRLGTFKRLADHLMWLELTNVSLTTAVGEMSETLETAERQRAELKTATVNAAARIEALENQLAHERSKAEALADLVRDADETDAASAPAPDRTAVADLNSAVSRYRVALAGQRGGGEALLAFDEVFLAANRL